MNDARDAELLRAARNLLAAADRRGEPRGTARMQAALDDLRAVVARKGGAR